MKIKKIVLIIIVIFCFLLVSCPQICIGEDPEYLKRIAKENRLRGESLSKSYPSWVVNGYTSWLSWQSEQGKALHDYVSDSVIPDDYDGCFRIIFNGPDLGICFSDTNNTIIELMYIYSNGLTTSLTDSKFEADCYVKKRLQDENTELNRGKVTVNRNADESVNNFVLELAGKKLIDVYVHCYEDEILIKRPFWLKENIYDKSDNLGNFWSMYHFYDNYDPLFSILEFANNPYFGLEDPKPSTFYHFSYEGVSVRSQDDANHIFSLNLLDGKDGGFADYVEIRLRDDKIDMDNGGEVYDAVDLTFYKIIDGTPKVVKKYEKLMCCD